MDSDELKRLLGIDDDATYRVHPETGAVQRDSLFGWDDTDSRVDPETGEIQERQLFGWNSSDIRVDPDSGEVKERGLFMDSDMGLRVDPESGEIQKSSLVGWDSSSERINPGTGEYETHGLFGWWRARGVSSGKEEGTEMPERSYTSDAGDSYPASSQPRGTGTPSTYPAPGLFGGWVGPFIALGVWPWGSYALGLFAHRTFESGSVAPYSLVGFLCMGVIAACLPGMLAAIFELIVLFLVVQVFRGIWWVLVYFAHNII